MARWSQWAQRHPRRPPSLRAAVAWSLGWIALSLAVGALTWWRRGGDAGTRFYTAWLLEKSLSFDNLMVFLLLFARLRVPVGERPRVLGWGILGAVLLRGLVIVGGVGLVHVWRPVLYLFGAFLAYSGVRTLVRGDHDDAPEPRSLAWLRRRLRLPPLIFTIVVIELADLMFAVDSIPAVLGVTDDLSIVLSSNLLAVLGLRALYLVVERLLARLRYLRFGIGAILILVGAKMCLEPLLRVPPLVALAVTLAILAATAIASLVRRPPGASRPTPPRRARRAARGARASSAGPPAAAEGRS
jgi:tellurite resistance protein TerC